ncbi:enoyl-CoA hydratase-related protein [uncultured Sphingomonas sp.]|uniref:enoyl-CoA hydratase-related protein n=1 Tax=uncultured Sphingomonas sp. TaxID=158754 RepID=UPI002621A7EE|nr:enoyl-CoA hydratase-related protein [uncultured Sphingomonas sp.]
MSAALRLQRDGAIARLLIDRADKRNAFDQGMWEAFPDLLAEAMADPSVRVLVLQSAAPGAFSAGADIAEFSAGARDADWRAKNQTAIRRAQHDLARAPKPTIALIEGVCVGGGCGLAIACDLRVATPAARLGITPAKLGLVYSLHDTKLLVDLVGPAQAKRILFTGALIEAAEAVRIGLVDILADDAAAAAGEIAATIIASSPHSIGATKRIIRRILDGQAEDDADTLAQFDAAFTGEDFDEGVSAFLAKRKPSFRAR